jgi:hypothetical protein
MTNCQGTALVCAVGIGMVLAGCGNASHDATEAAINAAQTAINASKGAAEKFAPEQIKAAQEAVDEARHALAKSDYTSALKDAQDAVQKAKEAVATGSSRKEEWTKTWDNLSATAPKVLSEIQTKMDMYNKYGRLPKGVDSAQMEEAKSQYEQLKQGWADANAAHKAGDWIAAMKKATNFEEGLLKLRELLGLT